MNKKNIAILFGGHSSEYGISLMSVSSVFENIDHNKYNVIPVGITKDGDWYHYIGSYDKVIEDKWHEDEAELIPIAVSQSPKVHGILEFTDKGIVETKVDVAFPVLHGKNGEDGTVQGVFELAGIPVVGCGLLSSAVCMDKDIAHKLVEEAGIKVPKAVAFNAESNTNPKEATKELSYPLYVKPVNAGSSIGISKIYSEDELEKAVNLAFQYDSRVVIEENIEGFEVGCAVLGNEELTIGRVDEIEMPGGFFDFDEKYNSKVSKIHMPARIDAETEERIKKAAEVIYKALACSGLARVDMFLTPEGDIVFNEVNTMPGFTSHSRYPSMLKGIGISFSDIIEKLIAFCCAE